MKIGLTYDLRSAWIAMGYSELETAEFDREDTITSIENTLHELGHQTERIGHARELMTALLAGQRWDLVFNICEGMHGLGREALVPALLDQYQIPYTFSDPFVMSLSLHKGMTKRVLRDSRVPTTDFLVAEKVDDVADIHFPAPWFVKPVAEGTGKGITPDSIVRTQDDLRAVVQERLETFNQSVIIEPYLSGREFTVGIVGSGIRAEVLGTIEIILLADAEKGVYSYVNKENCEELVEYRLVFAKDDPVVAAAEKIALDSWRVLRCQDAGRIDLRCDGDENPQFLEVNPLAGIHPEHSDLPILCNKLNIPYTTLIERIIQSATERITH